MSEQQTDKSVAKPEFKADWYQTQQTVVISIFARNVTKDSLQVAIKENEIFVQFMTPTNMFSRLVYKLAHSIIPQQCTYKLMSTKIEITLKKEDQIYWTQLERNDEIKCEESTDAKQTKIGRNWNLIEKEIEQQESQKPANEEGLTNLFKDIYGKSSDEVKKAMNKSFLESGGTVLSTNWKEVSQKTVEVKPPDGVEFKKWHN